MGGKTRMSESPHWADLSHLIRIDERVLRAASDIPM
jgi:hypothetical protein